MKMQKKTTGAVAAVVVALSLAGCSAASGPSTPSSEPSSAANEEIAALVPDDIASAGQFTATTPGTTPPEGYKEADGSLQGYEIEVIDAVAEILGLKVDWQVADFASLIPSLQSGRTDLAVGQMGITAERADSVDFVTLIMVNQAFAANKTAGFSDITIDDLCGLTVAVTQGSRQQEFGTTQSQVCEDKGEAAIDLSVFQTPNEAWLALQSDRADIFWSGATAVGYLVSQVDGSEVVGTHLEPYPTGIALPKDSKLGPAIAAALQELIDDGSYAEILDEWGVSDNAEDEAVLNPEITW